MGKACKYRDAQLSMRVGRLLGGVAIGFMGGWSAGGWEYLGWGACAPASFRARLCQSMRAIKQAHASANKQMHVYTHAPRVRHKELTSERVRSSARVRTHAPPRATQGTRARTHPRTHALPARAASDSRERRHQKMRACGCLRVLVHLCAWLLMIARACACLRTHACVQLASRGCVQPQTNATRQSASAILACGRSCLCNLEWQGAFLGKRGSAKKTANFISTNHNLTRHIPQDKRLIAHHMKKRIGQVRHELSMDLLTCTRIVTLVLIGNQPCRPANL